MRQLQLRDIIVTIVRRNYRTPLKTTGNVPLNDILAFQYIKNHRKLE